MEPPEVFMIVTEGGPHPGSTLVSEDHQPWPLPGFIDDLGGRYYKVAESQYISNNNYVRGALYQWVSDGLANPTIWKVG